MAPRGSAQASAELVVPRSMPTTTRGRRGASGLALPDVQLELPALGAVAGDAPQLERADLGDAALERDRHGHVVLRRPSGSVTSSGLSSSSSSPQSSISVPARSVLRTSELRKRNSAGSPTTRPNSRPGSDGARALLHAERHHAQRLQRRRQPGHRRHRGLDADVVAARRAAADADAASAPRQAVIGGALRDRVIEIGRVEHVAVVERARSPPAAASRSSTSTTRARSAPAFMTPPLKSTWVGQARPLGPRRIGADALAAGGLRRAGIAPGAA